ncbi:MAG: HAD family hydrolase [Ignavibacteria bacterium]|nr:MAG: HAD family hydrolase [Ignavibacteria bacterium]
MNYTERLKKIKLIVLDLDGTLLNDEQQVGQESKELIKRLIEMGVHVTFASGRLHSAIKNLATELEIQTPLISLDGALIKQHPGDTEIYHASIKRKNVVKAIQLADKNLLKIALCHADAIYYTEDNELIPQLVDKFGAKFEQIYSYDDYLDDTLEIVMVGDYRETIKNVASSLMFPFTFGLDTNYYKSHRNKGIYYIECRKNGSSKGSGLKRLQKHLKINMNETVVVGDWYNDRSLFETKALKVTVNNAVPEIQRLADIKLKRSNNEDGTAELFEMILKAKGK